MRMLPGARRQCRTVLDVSTNGNGCVVTTCRRCDHQAAGRCWRCFAVRENRGARALFCDACREKNKAEANARHERSPQAKKNARRRDRQRRKTEHRKAWRAAWLAANPDKVRAYKRRSALNPTPRKRERERYHNSRPERIEAKRAQARARYYELHPERPQPVCRGCSRPIAWQPPGRPPVRCDQCVPASVSRKRRRPVATVGAP